MKKVVGLVLGLAVFGRRVTAGIYRHATTRKFLRQALGDCAGGLHGALFIVGPDRNLGTGTTVGQRALVNEVVAVVSAYQRCQLVAGWGEVACTLNVPIAQAGPCVL